jgi:hypothetical protein
MFDVAKRREPGAETREEKKDFYREDDFSLERRRVAKTISEMVGYSGWIPVDRGELRREIQSHNFGLGETERY